MLKKEVIEAGQQIASDLYDAQVAKTLGVNKDPSEYKNGDLIQQYLDEEICSVEAIYLAMKRAE